MEEMVNSMEGLDFKCGVQCFTDREGVEYVVSYTISKVSEREGLDKDK